MKRKITFAFIAMASVLMSMAYADGFGTLVFKSVSGESYNVETQGLEIYFKDGNVTFNNDALTIPVASLVSMEFSDNPGNISGVQVISSASTGSVVTFSIDGVKTGEFSSLSDAYRNLKPGLYVVRHSDGSTSKIKVGK